MSTYRGWTLTHSPARREYLAQRFGTTLHAPSPIMLLALVNNAIAQGGAL